MKSALDCYRRAAELKMLADGEISESARQRLLRTAEEWRRLGVNTERNAQGDGLRSELTLNSPYIWP
jgi:hypothetical protein